MDSKKDAGIDFSSCESCFFRDKCTIQDIKKQNRGVINLCETYYETFLIVEELKKIYKENVFFRKKSYILTFFDEMIEKKFYKNEKFNFDFIFRHIEDGKFKVALKCDYPIIAFNFEYDWDVE